MNNFSLFELLFGLDTNKWTLVMNVDSVHFFITYLMAPFDWEFACSEVNNVCIVRKFIGKFKKLLCFFL
jgi:hypothetical protein